MLFNTLEGFTKICMKVNCYGSMVEIDRDSHRLKRKILIFALELIGSLWSYYGV